MHNLGWAVKLRIRTSFRIVWWAQSRSNHREKETERCSILPEYKTKATLFFCPRMCKKPSYFVTNGSWLNLTSPIFWIWARLHMLQDFLDYIIQSLCIISQLHIYKRRELFRFLIDLNFSKRSFRTQQCQDRIKKCFFCGIVGVSRNNILFRIEKE